MTPSTSAGLVFLLTVLVAQPAPARQPTWYVLAREDGCIDLKVLVKPERLPRTPDSPEDFARMKRERGEAAVLGQPRDLPPGLAGKVVQIDLGGGKAPVFVRREVCRSIAPGK